MPQMNPSDYTSGEVRALLAPIFGMDADDMGHYAIIIDDENEHKYKMIGCAHSSYLLHEVRIYDAMEAHYTDDTASHNVGIGRKGYLQKRDGMARRMLRMPFRRNHSR